MRRRTRFIAPLVAICAICAIAASSAAAATGVSGTVRGPGSTPLEGISVCGFAPGEQGPAQACTNTGPTGGYQLELEPGQHKLQFRSNDVPGYVSEYYDDRTTFTTADAVTVTEGEVSGPFDAQLRQGGAISGRVTNESSEAVELMVCAQEQGSPPPPPYDCRGTNASGEYTLSGLAPGEWLVWFQSQRCTSEGCAPTEYVQEYYDNAKSAAQAKPVTVVAGEIEPGIDAQLEKGATINGRVIEAGTESPLAEVQVCTAVSEWMVGECRQTDSKGDYHFAGLAPGTYRVVFTNNRNCGPEGCEHSNYLQQYYDETPDGTQSFADATQIPLAAGDVKNSVNASMQRGGSIAGTVTDTAHLGLADVNVCVNQTNGMAGGCDRSDSEGHYKVVGLPTGQYRIAFQPPEGSFYVPQYWDHTSNPGNATAVPLTVGEALTAYDGVLEQGGAIAGKVYEPGEAPIAGLQVCAHEASSQWMSLNCSQTNAGGEYSIVVPAGSYRVQFTNNVCTPPEGCGISNLVRQWYDGTLEGTREFEEAADVAVVVGAPHVGIDAHMQHGAKISGKVTKEGTTDGIQGVQACAEEANGSPFGNPGVECAQTNPSGDYTILGLPGGEYKVHFNTSNSCGPEGCFNLPYVAEYWDGKPKFEGADSFSLSPGGEKGEVNASLLEGATIKGTVRDEGGSGIPRIGVCLEGTGESESEGGGCAQTNGSGEYELTGIAPHAYYVQFQGRSCGPEGCFDENYVSKWWQEATRRRNATPVTLSSGETSEFDAVLEEGAEVTGKVEDSGGVGIPQTMVCAEYALEPGQEEEEEGGACTQTDESGNYVLKGIGRGDYTIHFTAQRCDEEGCRRIDYVPEYYEDKPSPEGARVFELSSGDLEANVNAVLADGASILGTVEGKGGAPLPHIGVCVFDYAGLSEGQEPFECVQTNGSGEYALRGLREGEYAVRFSGQSCGEEGCFEENYVDQYWDGARSPGDADPIPLSAGASKPEVDAVMVKGAEVSGKVTRKADGSAVPETQVCAQPISGGEGFEGFCRQTDENGDYRIIAIPEGEYVVEFNGQSCGEEGCEQQNYLLQFYKESPSFEGAKPLPLAPGDVKVGVDAALEEGGTISGTVVDAAKGKEIPGLQVCANLVETGEGGRCANTAADGGYEIVGLATGEYIVEFSNQICGPEECAPSDWVRQYFDGAPSWDVAEPVSVTVGHETGAVGAEMVKGGAISGTVTEAGPGGEAIAGLEVCAQPTEGQASGECANTEGDGSYVIHGLGAGKYTVEFSRNVCGPEECEATFFVPQYYEGKTDPAVAKQVEVVVDQTTPNIDAQMAVGGALAGTVSDLAGTPIEGALACAYESGGGPQPRECEQTGMDGGYRIYLPAGSYKVEFSLPEYVTQFYSGKTTLALADPVAVTASATHLNVDAKLAHAAPVNTGPPTLEGEPVVGKTLTCEPGIWTNSPTKYEYAWHRDGTTIAGEAGPTHVVVADDRGYDISCVVTARNADASGEATSNALSVPPLAPVNTGLPQISGTAAPGEDLQCSTGTWEHSPTDFRYAWKRDGSALAGKTQSEYTVQNEDRGHAITCEVTAENKGGTGTATSAALQIPPPAPVNTAAPVLSGTPAVGQTLSCSKGSWENAPTDWKYAWTRDGTTIAGKTASTYTVEAVDRGHAIACEVTAENTGGAATAKSNTMQIPPPPPVNTAAPVLSGTPAVGQTLSCSKGGWENAPTSWTYAWKRDGVVIAGLIGSTYTVQDADRGHGVSCEVTAANEGGSASAESNSLQVPPPPAANPPAPPEGEQPKQPGLAYAASTAKVKGGKAKLKLTCKGEAACKGVAKLLSGKTQIGKASFSIELGKTETVSVKLTSKGQKLLRKAGNKGLSVKLGGTGVNGRKLTLKP